MFLDVKDLSPPTIVLGMHRSGTSLLTGVLEEAGLSLGEVNKAAPHNKKGNHENETLRAFHESIIARHGADWKTPPETPIHFTAEDEATLEGLLRPYRTIRNWGFKDPRAIWLLDAYQDIFPEAHLIGIFRHPMAVAKSLSARAGDLYLPIEKGIALWIQTNERLLQFAEQKTFPLLAFTERGIADPLFGMPFVRFLKTLGLNSPQYFFFDENLIHHGVVDEASTPAEAVALYERLLAVARRLTRENTFDPMPQKSIIQSRSTRSHY
jgi:hypothetical protein